MPVQVINGVGIAGIGTGSSSQSGGGSSPSFDTDAQAFITAASITATTQQNAVNDLVLDLKAANLWTKMKALYPMVGGTSSSHKWNLKDPRDLDAAYRLVFNGGWTHSSTGALPNGSNAFADSWFNPRNNAILYNQHLSYYSRTQTATATNTDMGAFQNAAPNVYVNSLASLRSDGISVANINANDTTRITYSETDARGLFVVSRTANNSLKYYKNTIIKGTNTTTTTLINPNFQITLGALNLDGGATQYSNKQCAFASIGDGLTDLESNLFYQIVEKFQYALGRNVNASKSFYFNRNYSLETNAFIFNGGITGSTEMSATNTLVSDLKAAGLWNKMQAIYPMVGGTASSHKFNLKDPRDLDAAYRLVFNGGWTHNSNGIQGNGSNSWGNTFLSVSPVLSSSSAHFSLYSRTDIAQNSCDFGVDYGTDSSTAMYLKWSDGNIYADQHSNHWQYPGGRIYAANNSSTGFYLSNRRATNDFKLFKNNTILGSNTSTTFGNLPPNIIVLGAINIISIGIRNYSTRQYAFASIGNGLTNLESNLFYQIVEKFQSALGRNINATQPFYYSSGYTNETNAFVFNGGITDATQISATNTLVSTLKTAGIWSKMKAVYPMVGGTATAHKFNLVNPVDSTSAYALTFAGGWTHSSTGALPNGSNTFANTSLNPSVNLVGQQNNMHLSYYSRTNVGGNMDIAMTTWTSPYTYLYIKTTVDKIHSRFNTGNAEVSTSNTNSLGLFILNRTLSTSLTFFRNGNPTVLSQNSTGISNGNILLGGNTAISDYGNKQCAFASIGDGLTDAEALTFYNAVQAFQTSLGRQV